MFKDHRSKTCNLPGDCSSEHVFNPATCHCVLRNSPVGRIISRGLDMKVPHESTYPAYADQMFYDLVAGLTKQVSDLMLSKSIEGGSDGSELANRARLLEEKLMEQEKQIQTMQNSYDTANEQLIKVFYKTIIDIIITNGKTFITTLILINMLFR